MAKIKVKDTEVTVMQINNEDYICITDMIRAKDGEFFVSDWLRNRNTLEYIGIWEQVYNPNFNYGEFAIIKSQAGSNNFVLSVKQWIERVVLPFKYGKSECSLYQRGTFTTRTPDKTEPNSDSTNERVTGC